MSARLPAPLVAYRVGLTLLSPVAPLWLGRRAKRGKEDPRRIRERYGHAGRARPPGDLVWIHGASIGETLSMLPVIEELTARGLPVLVTSGTRTSAEILSRRLPPGAQHQFLPLDVPRFVRRFLDHWRPHLALFAESELWPTLITELDRRAIPLILANARLSPRSARRWQKLPAIAGALMGKFTLCLAQSKGDAERLAAVGVPLVQVPGNLKFDNPPLPANLAAVEALAGLTAGRPVWVAASTHHGEDELVIAAHKAAARRHPDLLTIIVPRHPERGDEIAFIAAEEGLRVNRRARDGRPERGIEIHVADTVGELGVFYRVAPLVFMGGSLVPHGGQNPIEPARLGTAILHGPHIANFADVYAAFDARGGALQVENGAALAAALTELLGDPGLLRDMARVGGKTVAGLSGALARTIQAIEPYLPPPRDPAEVAW